MIMIITASWTIFSLALFDDITNLASSTIAFSEGALIVKHDIQTTNKSNSCMYTISVQVLNNQTLEVMPNALVEFKTPVSNTISNNTDKEGNTSISFVLEKGPQQKNCTETLLSQGYFIEAFKEGYRGYGVGKVS